MRKCSVFILRFFILCHVGQFLGCSANSHQQLTVPPFLQFGPSQQYYGQVGHEFKDTSKNRSFFAKDQNRNTDTVYFDLYVAGGPAGETRFFSLSQVHEPATLNAVPGLHYKAFNDPDLKALYCVPPGETHVLVPIILYRHMSLKENVFFLRFQLMTDGGFIPGNPAFSWRKIIFSEQVLKPSLWDDLAATVYWGKYSRVKHEFMINQTGQNWDDEFMSAFTLIDGSNYALYWKKQLTELLIEYNKLHPGNPLIDENGLPVLFNK